MRVVTGLGFVCAAWSSKKYGLRLGLGGAGADDPTTASGTDAIFRTSFRILRTRFPASIVPLRARWRPETSYSPRTVCLLRLNLMRTRTRDEMRLWSRPTDSRPARSYAPGSDASCASVLCRAGDSFLRRASI